MFDGRIFQQTIGIPMGTNCAPLLADLFLYLYEAEFVQSLLQAGKKHLAQQFNYTYARACSNYQDFMERGKVLTTKLLSQGYQNTKLVAALKKFYGRHHDLAFHLCSSHLDSSKNMAARGRGLFSLYIYIEKFKNLLVRNHWTDFNIILQKCSFGDPLPRLFKLP